MKLSQQRIDRLTAGVQLFMVGIMAAFAFEREICIGDKAARKLRKKRLKAQAKKAKKKGLI